jgi:hypothetical protein
MTCVRSTTRAGRLAVPEHSTDEALVRIAIWQTGWRAKHRSYKSTRVSRASDWNKRLLFA